MVDKRDTWHEVKKLLAKNLPKGSALVNIGRWSCCDDQHHKFVLATAVGDKAVDALERATLRIVRTYRCQYEATFDVNTTSLEVVFYNKDH